MRMLEQTEEEQVLSDLHSLKTLYGLLHKDPANENLDETSRAFLMRILDDATQQVLLRQAKMILGPVMSPTLERKLSIQLDPRMRGDAVPRLKPIASPSPSLHASERSRWLKVQDSVRSRDSRHAHEDHLLVRVASNRSSKTSMPQDGTVAGETPCSDRRGGHVPRRSSDRGDQSSMERSSNTSRSLSRESSVQERAWRLHPGTSAFRSVETEGSSMSRLSRLDSELSVSVASRGGSGRAGRGAATTRLSSPPRRRREDVADAASVSMGLSSRPRRTLNWIDSGNTYSRSSSSSGATASFPSSSLTEPSTSGTSASSSSSSVSPRDNAQLEYGFEASGGSKRHHRRTRERQKKRERLQKFKNKHGLVFHHRHDHHHHHHHHHFDSSSTQEGRLSRRNHHRKSPWSYLGGVFNRMTGHGEKTTTSRTVASVPAKRHGGTGHAHKLFDALARHKWGARRAPARVGKKGTRSSVQVKKRAAKRPGGAGHAHKLFDALARHMSDARKAPARAGKKGTRSRVQVKKLHWWQRMRRGRGRAVAARSSRPHRRLGHGKAV